MKFTFVFLLFFYCSNLFSQDFDKILKIAADSLVKKILATEQERVAIANFANMDGKVSDLGIFFSQELTIELSNRPYNTKNFQILQKAKVEEVLDQKKFVEAYSGKGMALEMGKADAADILVCGTIRDFEGFYRISIEIYDTKMMNRHYGGCNVKFPKTPDLARLYEDFLVVCDKCEGTGQAETRQTCLKCKGSKHLTCEACSGKGGYNDIWAGWISCKTCNKKGVLDCGICEGKGYVSAGLTECNLCEGKGVVLKSKKKMK